jgi:hypothetical protein
VFTVRTPAPPPQEQQQQQEADDEQLQADQQEPQQQAGNDAAAAAAPAAAGAQPPPHSATHVSLLLLFNAEALGRLALSLNHASRHVEQGRVLLLHLEPHSSRFLGKCCKGQRGRGHDCQAEVRGGCRGQCSWGPGF